MSLSRMWSSNDVQDLPHWGRCHEVTEGAGWPLSPRSRQAPLSRSATAPPRGSALVPQVLAHIVYNGRPLSNINARAAICAASTAAVVR